MSHSRAKSSGFTLIELSIVLVIIGLIVGGVLVGQDLIRAAAVRAQITQIDKFNTAVNTFRAKYGYLPGDIKDPEASNFGFQPRGSVRGTGDGNGVIEGLTAGCGASVPGFVEGVGELAVFWQDLSIASFIDVSIPVGNNQPSAYASNFYTISSISKWIPEAKIGGGNFIYLYSTNSTNYFALSSVTQIGCTIDSSANLRVSQAYAIDKKVDDGLPQSGNVTANYVGYHVSNYASVWASGGGGGGCVAGSRSSFLK